MFHRTSVAQAPTKNGATGPCTHQHHHHHHHHHHQATNVIIGDHHQQPLIIIHHVNIRGPKGPRDSTLLPDLRPIPVTRPDAVLLLLPFSCRHFGWLWPALCSTNITFQRESVQIWHENTIKQKTTPKGQMLPFSHMYTTPSEGHFCGPQLSSSFLYTEQTDAEGLGRKLLLTPLAPPGKPPEIQTVGTAAASDKMLTLQALSSSLNARTKKRGCLGRGKLLGDLWQSVPQNGCIHFHIIQQLRFGVFREGVFQEMPALEGQALKDISVRFAGENHLRTQKNTKQNSAQRFLKDPFFSAAEL